MRGLVLLLLAGGLIWAVLFLFPSSEEPTAGSNGNVGIEANVPPKQPIQGQPAETQPVQQPKPEPKPAVEPPAKQSNGFSVPIGQADMVELGALLAHGSSQNVLDWLQNSNHILDADMEWAMASFAAMLANDRTTARDRAQKISSEDALPTRVRWVLQRLLSGNMESPWPTTLVGGNPIEVGLLMRTAVIEADNLAKQRLDAAAAERLTLAFLGEINAPWPAHFESLKQWRTILDQVQARYRFNPKGEWPSEQVVVQSGDSLALIRKRYIAAFPDRLINTGLIARVNAIDDDLIHPDQVLRIPTAKVTMLVDLDAHWLLYFHDGQVVAAYPVGIGAEGDETILGDFTIGEKQVEPTWFRRDGPPIVFGEKENPLGTRYMTWFQDGQKTHYGFHGTWEPETIGGNESQGCIRMYNHDVEEFFELVPQGASFHVQP